MKWVEIIFLRSATNYSKRIDRGLLASYRKKYQGGSLKEIKIYRHGVLEMDLSVQLHWDSSNVDLTGSEAALQLIELLKEYGLVNHTVWIEEVHL